jgi:hypothetical protein
MFEGMSGRSADKQRAPLQLQYGMLCLAKGGKIKLLREFIDQIPASAALLPNGIAEIPNMKL